MSLKHLSLFSGLGGFDLASEWMGWENVAHCEINEFCLKILKYYWPNAATHTDIKSTDFTIYRGLIDIVSGGFPCQPYSQAGKRKGKEDERHLWPEMLRAIGEIQPSWVVGENVLGLVNWNGGLVFDEVQADLEAEGYEVQPFVLPACGLNAPHRRDRVWFIAYTGLQRQAKSGEQPMGVEQLYESRNAANTSDKRLQRRSLVGSIGSRREESKQQFAGLLPSDWQVFPTQSPICNGNDGISTRLDFASVFGSIKHPRQPARAFGKWRNESIKAGGNAIVPQVVHQIFKAIQQYENIA